MEDREIAFNTLCDYIVRAFPTLDADEIRDSAESGLTMAEDVAKDKVAERSTKPEGEDTI